MYGKLRNGKLLISRRGVIREGKLILEPEEELLKKLGYKKVVYKKPPIYKSGYELSCRWEEDDEKINQIWDQVLIEEDYSSEFLVIFRNFKDTLEHIIISLDNMLNKNETKYNDILKKNPIIKEVCTATNEKFPQNTPYEILKQSDNLLNKFFKKIGLEEKFVNDGYTINDSNLYNDNNESYIQFRYFKYNLDKLHHIKKFEDMESRTQFNMSYVYMHTLFDEYILNVIKTINIIEHKSLNSKEEIKYEEILKCKSLEELINNMINKNIEKLAWCSYKEKIDYFIKRGIKFEVEDSILYDDMIYFAEKRNAIVHNKSQFNLTNISKLKGTKYYQSVKVDERVECNVESFKSESEIIINISKELYKQVCEKYKLLNTYE